LASWKANDQLTLMGGITNGWNNFDDVNDHQSFLGGAILKSSDEDTSLAVSLSTGVDSFTPPTAEGQRTLLSTVFSRNITDRLTYVFQNDTGWQNNAFGNGEVAEWYGINQYLFYKINCCWSAGIRAEWFRDDDGYVVGSIGNIQGMNPQIGGFAGDFYEITLGLNWKPNGNFIFRPEVKWDWYNGLPGAGGTQPYVDGTDNTQFLAGFDLIYLF
jgi:hypothetical protein